MLSAESLAISKHRSRTYELSEMLVNMFHKLYPNMEDRWSRLLLSSDNNRLEKRLFSETCWKQLMIASCLVAEKLCATLRRRAELLDSMTFASVKERTKVTADLKDRKGFSRALNYAEYDERERTAQFIGGAITR